MYWLLNIFFAWFLKIKIKEYNLSFRKQITNIYYILFYFWKWIVYTIYYFYMFLGTKTIHDNHICREWYVCWKEKCREELTANIHRSKLQHVIIKSKQRNMCWLKTLNFINIICTWNKLNYWNKILSQIHNWQWTHDHRP
jgi:hypothetical protein